MPSARVDPVSSEFRQAARGLLASPGGDGDSPKQVAERATQVCDRLARHLARLLGDIGIQTLLKRSIVLASAEFPWLPTGPTPESPSATLRLALEQQDAESITEAFVAVLSAFVGLLERLIGSGLVERLLDEVWPDVFPHPSKDTP